MRVNRQIDSVEGTALARPVCRHAFQAKHRFTGRHAFQLRAAHFSANHHFGKAVTVGFRGGHFSGQPSASKHHDTIAHPEDFVQLVGNDDCGTALIDQAPQRREEAVGFLWSQDRGRFVQNQYPGVGIKRLEDFYPLPLAHRQFANPGVGFHLKAELFRQLPQPVAAFGKSLSRGPKGFAAEDRVFQDRQVVCQREVLVDHADARCDRRFRRPRRQRFAVDLDMSVFGHIVPEDDVH